MKTMKKAYYARPISVDDTPQMERDLNLIWDLGYEPSPTAAEKVAIMEAYKIIGMDAFRPAVLECDLVVFRAFPDGSIGAGVAKELAWAIEKKIPVVEFPRQIDRRTLTVDQTRNMLAELGQR